MNNFRNNEKHKKHSGVFLWSSDKQPPHTRPRRARPGALNTSDRAWFYYPWDYETVSVLLFTNFTPPPLNRWANGGKPGEVTAVSLIPLGTAIFARKPCQSLKYSILGQSGGSAELADVTSGALQLTAEQHSETSHWHCFVKWKGPCHLKPPTLFFGLPE